jgi:IMP dehydrogenase
MREALTYDDVTLVPQFSEIRSRKEIDISVDFHAGVGLEFPVISSPMDTVTGPEMLIALDRLGSFGVLHRYCSIEQQASMVLTAVKEGCTVGAAIGVTGYFEERACELYDAGAKVLCIDVAHGHHFLVRDALEILRSMFGDAIHIMAGNVATLDAFNDLVDWGADSVRCSVGAGSCCTTRTQTGHGLPGLQTILDCSETDRDGLIIADGGIRTAGDIVKALAAGADLVMVGSLFAGTDESPGPLIQGTNGELTKGFRGMASAESQDDWKGIVGSLEGISSEVPYKGSVTDVVEDLVRGIRSGLSYSGARNIEEFYGKSTSHDSYL